MSRYASTRVDGFLEGARRKLWVLHASGEARLEAIQWFVGLEHLGIVSFVHRLLICPFVKQ